MTTSRAPSVGGVSSVAETLPAANCRQALTLMCARLPAKSSLLRASSPSMMLSRTTSFPYTGPVSGASASGSGSLCA